MIELKITASSFDELQEILGSAATVMLTVAAAPARTTRSRKADKEETPPTTGGATTADASGASSEGSTAAAVNRDTVAPKCSTYAQKAGPAALQELFRKHGSEKGNWSGVPEASLPALNVELDELNSAA
jgi:hypothetical protein